MKNRKVASIIAIIVLVIIFILVIKNNKTQPVGVYKVGVLLPLTGDVASYGEPGKNVFELAKNEINSAGGINGGQLELVYEDSKCDGAAAANAAQKLVNVDQVQFIIGGLCSTESLSAVPIAATKKVAMLSAVSTSPKLTGISPYFFRISPSDASQGELDAQVAMKKGYKTVAVIQEQLDYPLGLSQVFTQNMEKLGGKTIVEAFPANTDDFKTILTKLKLAKPDALFLDTQDSPTAQRVLKQLQDLGWKPKIIINEAIAGDIQALGTYGKLLEGAIGAEFSARLDSPTFQHLLTAYKKAYGKELPYQGYGQTEYDAVYLLREGIIRVGYNGEKLATWSRTIKDWQGASGSITIKPDGDRTTGYSPEIVKNGKMESSK